MFCCTVLLGNTYLQTLIFSSLAAKVECIQMNFRLYFYEHIYMYDNCKMFTLVKGKILKQL